MKLTKSSTSLAAVAALLVMASVASASPELTDPAGTTASAGSLIEANNITHTTNTVTPAVMTTATGNIECATATLTGELTKNSGSVIEGNVTTVEFGGTVGKTPHSTDCTGPGSLGPVTITPNHSTNPSHNGVASLPWCVKAEGATDSFTVRGGKCSEAARALVFIFHSAIGACGYEKASFTGTYTTSPTDAIAKLQGQTLTKTTGSAFCPSTGSLEMELTLKTDGTNTAFTIS